MEPSRFEQLRAKVGHERLDLAALGAAGAEYRAKYEPKKPDWYDEALGGWSFGCGQPPPMKIRRSDLAAEAYRVLAHANDGTDPLTEKSQRWLLGVMSFFAKYPSGTSREGEGELMGLESEAHLDC